jgi:hypothetical protein
VQKNAQPAAQVQNYSNLQDAITQINKVVGTKVDFTSLRENLNSANQSFKAMQKSKDRFQAVQHKSSSKLYATKLQLQNQSEILKYGAKHEKKVTQGKRIKLEKKIAKIRYEKQTCFIKQEILKTGKQQEREANLPEAANETGTQKLINRTDMNLMKKESNDLDDDERPNKDQVTFTPAELV